MARPIRPFIPATLLALGCLTTLAAPPALRAQGEERSDPSRSPIALHPNVGRVQLRGDTVRFLDPLCCRGDSVLAYAYLRASGRWARLGRLADSIPGELVVPYRDSVPVGDGFSLIAVQAAVGRGDSITTHVLRGPDHTIYGLRALRIAAQRDYLRRNPPPPDTRDGDEIYAERLRHGPPIEYDGVWDAVQVVRAVRDGNSLWLGTAGGGPDDPKALGGLMRFDFATRQAEVIEHPALMRRTVRSIALVDGGVWVHSADALHRYDPATRRWTTVDATPTGIGDLTDMETDGRDLFLSAAEGLARYRPSTGRWEVRYFDLALAGDTIVYALTDSMPQEDWDRRAIFTVIEAFHIRRAAAFARAARGVVTAAALKVWDDGDRVVTDVGRDSAGTFDGGGEVPVDEGTIREIVLGGMASPALAPFYAEALRDTDDYERLILAQLLEEIGDRRWLPQLRAALIDSTPSNLWDAYAADIAVVLHRLGDPAGARWVRDTLARDPGPDRLHPDVFEAAWRIGDPATVPVLMNKLADSASAVEATAALMHYRDVGVWKALVARLGQVTAESRQYFINTTAYNDSIVVSDENLRLAVRMFARRATTAPGAEGLNATTLLGKIGDPADVPTVIAVLAGPENLSFDFGLRALINITGVGDTIARRENPTPADRAAAQRWWTTWYRTHPGYVAPPRAVREAAVERWWSAPSR